MKTKIIILFIILFSINNIIAQETVSEAIEALEISETERIIDKYGGKIAESFMNLMDTATPVAKEGFQMVVRLQIAKGIVMLIPIILCTICIILFISAARSMEEDDNFPNGAMVIISGIIGVVTLITALFLTGDGILHIIAPEWFAIKEIIALVN